MTWLRFVWDYVVHRKHLLAMVLVFSVVIGLAELTVPWLIKEAVDAVLDESGSIDLEVWAASALGLLVVLYLAHALLLRAAAHMIQQCSYKLRSRVLSHIHSQTLPFFQRHRTGELTHRVTSDTKIFEDTTGRLLNEVPVEFVTLVGVSVMMVLLHPGLGLLVIVFMGIAAAVTGYLGQPLPGLRVSAQRVTARLSGRLQETIVGVRTVQGFKNEAHELARLDEENRAIRDLELKEGKVHALMLPMGELMELLGLVLVVWYGGHLIMRDAITAGTLVAFIAYMEILARPLGNAEAYFRDLQTSRAVATRLQELLADREVLPVLGRRSASDGAPSIVAQDVWFRHAGDRRDILRGVSFTVGPGEVVAVAGRNGAGKSTLMDLLLRFYYPTSGRVLAGGTDLREWDIEAWRRLTGVMPQEVFLFRGAVAENIAYGRPGASPEEIERAVRESGVDRILRRFPDGLATVVGERGTQLSGGERQAIALARLFLRKPRLLVLDEPTSQLDGEALQVVGASLKPLMQGCTTFVVTHSLETIQIADRVLFFEAGRLAGDGTHEALYRENAAYRALWEEGTRARQGPKKKQVGQLH